MMQTFWPYPSFAQSASCLDRQRLGKQRVEVWQMLRALTGQTDGWRNHPCVKAWEGHEPSLAVFGMVCCREWIGRGYKDTTLPKIVDLWRRLPVPTGFGTRPWQGNGTDIHSAYRALLLHKDPDHYGQFGWTETPIDRFPWEVLQ